MKVLSIIETPYRGTVEEQDDAAFWFTHAVKNALSGDFGVLLRGNAVSYAVRHQSPEGLVIGGVALDRPCRPHEDLSAMRAAGMTIHAVREDLVDLGISPDDIVTDVELVDRSQVASLVECHDQIWHW